MDEETFAQAEELRLREATSHERNWERWGPYLAERQWGTVREDYSPDGTCWDYFPHDHARSRVYRWGEDGLLGICDRECRLCFAVALWNGQDPILKERLFGLTNAEGNHGEDVKECYFYLDAVPSSAYLRALYKYPQRAYPYARLVEENRRRSRAEPEYELLDTGVFDEDRYFDLTVEYAKASPNDMLIRLTVANRGPATATLHLLPTLWFRNTWIWGQHGEDYWTKPRLSTPDGQALLAEHASLGRFWLLAEQRSDLPAPRLLFTENETNFQRLFGVSNATPYVKDAFHAYVIEGRQEAVNPAQEGTKAAFYYVLTLPAAQECRLHLRLFAEGETPSAPFGEHFSALFVQRRQEADAFYAARIPPALPEQAQRVIRQANAGLLWNRQFYNYDVATWLKGDPTQPSPPSARLCGRNHDWKHLFNRDILSVPDKWEYPWYAAWDLAFHAVAFASLDPDFAKQQLILLLREWYMHPNGQLPAYEFAFSDTNPPVHAWACWRVYKMTAARGSRDLQFLARTFHKLLINFTWWVNRKDVAGRHLFSGGFLGLDNIGLFDRSRPLPGGEQLEQADGTAWMAFYCLTMLAIALELAHEDHAYEDVASKFFEHFIAIVDAMNALGGNGMWDEEDGFYYDQLLIDGRSFPLRVRSAVGIIPLLAVDILDDERLTALPGFTKRLRWFLENRPDLARHISYLQGGGQHSETHRLLAIPSRERLLRVLRYLLDEDEFLSPYGVRSLSRYYRDHPYTIVLDGQQLSIDYEPAESRGGLFGGNSNWRGPIWFPLNYLLIEALERYHRFYGTSLLVECPTGSGKQLTLAQVAQELTRRLCRLFLPDEQGKVAWCGEQQRFLSDPYWRDLILFCEYFDGETGRGLGASHQTGWTALIARLLTDLASETATVS
ncbi:MGH1-like glycoside hydrolase domain-containing protein [Thermogemmatispora tikiterensis]|uniref:Glucosidase n=1 Tax=Thermogemmatispora tikiterensis TaxID=1825093 RepID=A0A328VLG1_9CHLR|nr:glucosidase [Thermogemmatispora tikiterensis]RAQ95035.1 glucosidase [Thermogemmatispora tikiterensis]